MNDILILDDGLDGHPHIDTICREWSDEFVVHSAPDEESISHFIWEKQVKLIICDLSSGYGPQLDYLASLTHIFPYIPCIAIISKGQHLHKDVLNIGVTLCLEAPVNPEEMKKAIHQVLDEAHSGTVRGIPVHSLLQMLETEEKTCTLKIQGKDGVGLIYLNDGVAVAAETDDHVNEEAMHSMLVWEDATVDILHFNSQRSSEIEQSLISIIMEAFRLKDERESQRDKPKENGQAKLELKQLSTSDNRLSLDVGARVQIEFSGLETHLVSSIVGMVTRQFIIVATPHPHAAVRESLKKDKNIVIKYLNMGRLCMFKTELIEEIESPHSLLFLKYPPIIHFHELRRAKRTNIYVPCGLQYGAKDILKGVLIDLSFVGCLFLTKSKGKSISPSLDIDSALKLSFKLPGAEQNQILTGKVKNIQKTTTEIRFGIEFIGLPNHLKEAIDSYVQTLENE